MASLCNGWARPASGMLNVPSQATVLFYGLKMTWWAVKAALSGVYLKNPGCDILHILPSLILLLFDGIIWVCESVKAA